MVGRVQVGGLGRDVTRCVGQGRASKGGEGRRTICNGRNAARGMTVGRCPVGTGDRGMTAWVGKGDGRRPVNIDPSLA